MKKFFLKRHKQRQSLIFLKNCEMSNFLLILELYAFYIEYKQVKSTAINVRGRTNVKYFMQTQVLRLCKDTAKVSSLPLLNITTKPTYIFFLRRRYQYCGLNFKQIKCLETLHLNTER